VSAECDRKLLMKDCLPQTNGRLLRTIFSSAILSANNVVLKCMESTEHIKHGKYYKYSSKEKDEIRKRAAKIGITAMIK